MTKSVTILAACILAVSATAQCDTMTVRLEAVPAHILWRELATAEGYMDRAATAREASWAILAVVGGMGAVFIAERQSEGQGEAGAAMAALGAGVFVGLQMHASVLTGKGRKHLRLAVR